MRNVLAALFALISLSCFAMPENQDEHVVKACAREYQAYQTAYLPFSSWCRVQVESGRYQNDADCKAHGYLTYTHERPKAAFAFKTCTANSNKD